MHLFCHGETSLTLSQHNMQYKSGMLQSWNQVRSRRVPQEDAQALMDDRCASKAATVRLTT